MRVADTSPARSRIWLYLLWQHLLWLYLLWVYLLWLYLLWLYLLWLYLLWLYLLWRLRVLPHAACARHGGGAVARRGVSSQRDTGVIQQPPGRVISR